MRLKKKTNETHKGENVENLYKYATIVLDQQSKNYPTGDIKRITIEDSYGTVIRININ